MKKLFLNNAVIKDLHLDNYDIAVYIALRSLFDTQIASQIITFNMIAYILYGNRNYTKYTVNHIKAALEKFLRVKSSLPKSIYLSEPLARFIQINFKKQLTQKPKCAAALVTDSIKR